MNTSNTQAQIEQPQTDTQPLGIPRLTNMMCLLLEKAEPNLTIEQLNWLANGANEIAFIELDNLHHVVESTACLVATDKEAGNFTDNDSVSILLHSIANQLDTIRALAETAKDAETYCQLKQKSNGQ